MSGRDGRKTTRNIIKPSTSTVSGEDHRELRNRKGLRKERGKDQLRILDVNFVLLGFIIVTTFVALFLSFIPFSSPMEMIDLRGLSRRFLLQKSWTLRCFKGSIRRAYIGELIVLMYISPSGPGL